MDAVLLFTSAVIQAGLLVYVAASLVADRTVTLRPALTERWPTALLVTLLGLLAFAPAMVLHLINHALANGQPGPVVWALMIWDSLVVGAIGTLVGSALFVAYRAGRTWRGWTARP